jgi:hypothetical protein
MDRRDFIKASLVVPIAVTAALSAACRAPAPRLSPTPDARVAPTVVPVVAPPIEPGPGALPFTMLHPVTLFADLTGRTGSQVASDDVKAWLTSHGEAERAEIVKLHDGMAEHGFTDFRDPRVFTAGDSTFYVIGNADGRNACAPFWVNGSQAALVEGPAITGLTALAKDWTSPGGVTAAQGLIPTGTLHRDKGSEFGTSFPYPYVYKTAAGQVSLNYQLTAAYPQGFVSVSAERANGDPLLRQEYILKLP